MVIALSFDHGLLWYVTNTSQGHDEVRTRGAAEGSDVIMPAGRVCDISQAIHDQSLLEHIFNENFLNKTNILLFVVSLVKQAPSDIVTAMLHNM